MKNNLFCKILSIVAFVGMAAGCTDRFEEFNTNPNGITERELSETVAINDLIKGNLKLAQRSIYVFNPAWYVQVQQNLNADIYSGYMMSPTPFQGNSNNMTYALVDGWNAYAFDPAYDFVLTGLKKVEDSTLNVPTKQDVYAMSKIIKVESLHRVSDVFGPIVYTKFGVINDDGTVDYDTQEEAYNAFFADLKTAIDILTPMVGKTPSALFAESDLVYGGNYEKWLRFANSLRLRLAMRLADVAPQKAIAEGEAALAHEAGLIETNDGNFNVDLEANNHPLNVFNTEWADIRFGAPLASYMKGYNDPRLPKYALPATDAAVAGEYIGIRQGINIDAKSRYEGYSKLITFGNKILLMTAAEVWFLKAEAALRGWNNAGTMGDNYEQGVSVSFAQHGVSSELTDYLNDDESTPAEYLDPKAVTPGQNDIKGASQYLADITIKWDDAADDDEKLERIITQKWIAMYPEGQEAWSEFRRTGYPILYPVIVNNSGGKIPGFIKRLPFTSNEYATNRAAINRIVSKMGADTGGTPLWWDVD
ncbi:SusD/RagB family nutrient-binding outer membrane lipoprotein [Pseudochryseolinea flava]|uniref:SusD/RagB family nutrient-binding outer membrane lipoprotein n=1 Tax=Pseudochryseolinea flava TaxID=2059302 RepID=A0A364XYD2_9BACT|nr:SusD/RagB family nutrient-binding outer membrane lipoprotein [Pseudochryseolinea flava]RAV99267.1 SusD/RagB family nutrient-binding outer membrane lipoprotein [Pseudochryseolinea flava]